MVSSVMNERDASQREKACTSQAGDYRIAPATTKVADEGCRCGSGWTWLRLDMAPLRHGRNRHDGRASAESVARHAQASP